MQGGFFTCTLSLTGAVACFGDNSHGQCGVSNFNAAQIAAPGPTVLSGVDSLAAGFSHVCALTLLGGVRCWGYNTAGQLGIGTYNDVFSPPTTDTLTGVAQITAGMHQTCVLMTTTGGLRCWGQNYVSRSVLLWTQSYCAATLIACGVFCLSMEHWQTEPPRFQQCRQAPIPSVGF